MGNLTRDPEMRFTPAGKAVCSLSIANNRVYTKNSEKVTEVSYFDVEVWGPAAENCSKYLTKGSGIIVEGRLKQDRWEKDGKTHSRVRITANAVHFMPKRQASAGGGADMEPAGSTGAAAQSSGDPDAVAWDE